jgi:hypothetical protein
MKNYIENNMFYCPISDGYFEMSDYLMSIFKQNPKALWFANMVMHYRHNHISWWNKCWGKHGYKYQGNWFGDYEEEKRKVNETAKRQIIRKCHQFINYHKITLDDMMQLQGKDEKTIELASKYFNNETM